MAPICIYCRSSWLFTRKLIASFNLLNRMITIKDGRHFWLRRHASGKSTWYHYIFIVVQYMQEKYAVNIFPSHLYRTKEEAAATLCVRFEIIHSAGSLKLALRASDSQAPDSAE